MYPLASISFHIFGWGITLSTAYVDVDRGLHGCKRYWFNTTREVA